MRESLDVLHAQTFRQLQSLPGVDARLASGLVRVGVASLDDLAHRDPHVLQADLERGGHAGALQVLAAAVHAARAGNRFTHPRV